MVAPSTTVSSTSLLPSPDFASTLDTFLDKLSPAMAGRLHEAPSSCLSIFRLLPLTAKHIVLNMNSYERELDMGTVSR